MDEKDTIHQFMDKVKAYEKGEKLDLSSGEDLSIGVMNLIAIEEHLFYTYNKTEDAKFLDLLTEVREMRKSLFKKIVKEGEGEVWCTSKHLLAASMRIMEVGTKALTKGERSEAEDLFKKSYQLYNMFWALNLGLMDTKEMGIDHKEKAEEIEFISEDKKPKKSGSTSIFDKLGTIIEKAVNCCKE